jgi:hypothetical protein
MKKLPVLGQLDASDAALMPVESMELLQFEDGLIHRAKDECYEETAHYRMIRAYLSALYSNDGFIPAHYNDPEALEARRIYSEGIGSYEAEKAEFENERMSEIREKVNVSELDPVPATILSYLVDNVADLAGVIGSYKNISSKKELFEKLMFNHVYPNIKDKIGPIDDPRKFVLKYFSVFLEEVSMYFRLYMDANEASDLSFARHEVNFLEPYMDSVRLLENYEKCGLEIKYSSRLVDLIKSLEVFFKGFVVDIKNCDWIYTPRLVPCPLVDKLFLYVCNQHVLREFKDEKIDTSNYEKNKALVAEFALLFISDKAKWESKAPERPSLEEFYKRVLAVPELPDFDGLEKVRGQLEVHLIRLGMRNQYNEVVDDAVFDGQVASYMASYNGEGDSLLTKAFYGLTGLKAIGKWMARKKYFEKEEVDEAVEALYEMLNYINALIVKGRVLNKNGANLRQQYDGRLILKIAELLIEHVKEIAVEIEAKLQVSGVDIDLLSSNQMILAGFQGGSAFKGIIEGVSRIESERQIACEAVALVDEDCG